MPSLRWGALWLIALTCATVSAQPTAAAPNWHFSWRAPAGCPSEADVHAALEAASVRSEAHAPLAIEARVERGAHAPFTLQLRFSGAAEAERQLDGDACDALAQACVWLSADLIRGLPAVVPVVPADTAEPAPQPSAAELEPAEPSPPPPAAFELAALYMIDSAVLPAVTSGPALEIAWLLAGLRIRAQVRVLSSWGRDTPRADADVRVRSQLLELALGACYSPLGRDLQLGVCANAVPGLLAASALGPGGHAALGGWLALEATLQGRLRVSPNVALQAELGLLRALLGPQLTFAPWGNIHAAAPVSVRAGLGVALRF
jgi:hypothetical protein